MIRSATFLMLILPLAAAAQFSYVTDQRISVSNLTGDVLTNPWGGGLNAAQYSTLDLDNDGKDDLVLFDRMANKVITYLNTDKGYVYNKDYEKFFPSTITNWLLLRDYNCDGKKDLFTGNTAGMAVFTNVTEPGSPPSWKQFYFYPDGTKTEAIYTKGFNGMVNLQTQYDDLPSVSDLDGDGDLDIVILRFPGGSTLEYHQNFSKERTSSCDSLIFERVTNTWGGFTECNCGSYAFNNAACPPPSGGREKHAGGKSLLILDSDGDGDQDVLFSESSCTQLYNLKAQGNGPTTSLLSFSTFPPVNAVAGVNFPSAYFEDLDGDGVKDIVVSPNLYANDFPNSQPDLKASNWFYKNRGTTAAPNFQLVSRNFLQDQMIEVGDNATPAFADYDNDGDLDMFIGQLTSDKTVARIAQYENTGTASQPALKLKTEDYLGMSGLLLFNIKPQWIDITGDAKTDLVFTATSLQNGLTSLYYVANKSDGAFDFSSQTLQNTGFNSIIRTENAYVTDVDQNGSMDILLGKSTGAVEFWKNTGKPGSFTFAKAPSNYLGLGTSLERQNASLATADLNADGKDDLILGDQTGILKIVGNYREATDASGAVTDIVYHEFLPGTLEPGYSTQNFGGRIWPTVANLFNTDKPAIVVGNILGGVQVLRHDNGGSLNDEPAVKVWPVPVERTGVLKVMPDRPVVMEMYSALGQRVAGPVGLDANTIYNLTVLPAAGGMYILKFTANNKSFARRIVIY